MHCVTRQNKLETPRDKDEVNKWEIRECDGRAHDPDTMVAPLTPKPTRKDEALVRAPPTIASLDGKTGLVPGLVTGFQGWKCPGTLEQTWH